MYITYIIRTHVDLRVQVYKGDTLCIAFILIVILLYVSAAFACANILKKCKYTYIFL